MKKDPLFWQDKCIIITGASSGIGEGLAHYLLKQGAKIGLLARTQSKLEQLTKQLAGLTSTDKIAWVCADVTDTDATINAIQQLEVQLGSCDVLIASAGIHHTTDVMDFDAVKANAVIATNLQGVVNSVAGVIPGMIQRKQGHLVAVSSVAAMVGLPKAASYSASKAAVITFFQSLRVDLHPLGIHATVVAPGFVDTPMITEQERQTEKNLLSAEQAAIRICDAIQGNRAIDWFPWQTWLACRCLSLLPDGLYRRIISHIPEI